MHEISKQTRPYYVFSPSYTSKSAGVVTLHRLCHYLNQVGQKAFIVHMCDMNEIINPWLNTPVLTKHEENYFISEGIDPVHVYPDIVKGNPCNAKIVARFLLHYPGAYGGSKEFPETDHVWSFSPHIASFTDKPKNVLSCPNIDTHLFWDKDMPRSGGCFYANKYLDAGNNLLPITEDMTKLEGSHKEIADILQRSEICYVYENTSVICESVLSGCPVVLIKSDYFNDCHNLETQTGKAGVKWLGDTDYMEPLFNEIGNNNAYLNYLEMCEKFFNEQLPRFIYETQ